MKVHSSNKLYDRYSRERKIHLGLSGYNTNVFSQSRLGFFPK